MIDQKILARAILKTLKDNEGEPAEIISMELVSKIKLLEDLFQDPAPDSGVMRMPPSEPAKRREKPVRTREPQEGMEPLGIPQPTKSLIITPDSQEAQRIIRETKPGAIGKGSPGVVKPIRLNRGAVTRKEDPNLDKWMVEELIQEVHAKTPGNIEIVPEGTELTLTLERNVIPNYPCKVVKLVYTCGDQKGPEGNTGEGWNFRTRNQDSAISPINLDRRVEFNIPTTTEREIDFGEIMESLQFQAEKVFRPGNGEIVNHTPIRRGGLRFDVVETSNGIVAKGAAGGTIDLNERDLQEGMNPNALVDEQ